MKFFNIDAHISVIADIKNIFENLGHSVECKSISGHTWVFGKEKNHIPELDNWVNLNDAACDLFYEHYKDELDIYDAFICAYPPAFSRLYERFDKPIFVVCATRYEFPYTTNKNEWLRLNSYINSNKNIILIANNLFDKEYCESFLNKKPIYIPSLCEYTGEKYTGVNDRCILYSKYKNIDGLINKDSLGKYSWNELYSNKAIAHIPYNYSTMSIFEQYTANVPLLFPSENYLTKLFFEESAMSEISFLKVLGNPPQDLLGVFCNANLYNNYKIFLDNISLADFYNKEWMPYLEYFDDEDSLKYKLKNLNFQEISKNIKKANISRKEKIYKLWEGVIDDL